MFVESVTIGSTAYPLLVDELSENYFAATNLKYIKKCVVPNLILKFHSDDIEKVSTIFNSLPHNMKDYGRILAESGRFVYCIYNIGKEHSIEIRKHRKKTPLHTWSKKKWEFMNTVLMLNVDNTDLHCCLSVPFEKTDIYPISMALQAKKIEISPSFTQIVGSAIEEAQDVEIRGDKNIIEFHKKTRVDVAAEVAVNAMNRMAGSSNLGQAASKMWGSFSSYLGY